MLRWGAATALRDEAPHFPTVVLQAWREITLRQWAWTTAIAVFLCAGHVVGTLPGVLQLVSSPNGPPGAGWSLGKSAGMELVYLAPAYCFLLAVSVAEICARPRLPPVRSYVAAAIGACGAAILIQIALYILVPSVAPKMGGRALLMNTPELLGSVMWLAANYALIGGLALAVYLRFRSARLAREAFNAAELERVAASREVLGSRLAAMQARVEPAFLMSTLAQVEALYERHPQAGDRMLDALIAYLHAALPQLRGLRSTLKAEVRLAESYLQIVQIRMGTRLRCRVDVRPEFDDCDFPPMVLLPLVDDALRNGLESLPHGGSIVIEADVRTDRARVRVCDDGLPRLAAANDDPGIATLRERLHGLYGATARLDLTANAPHGVVAVIEVPLDTSRNHR